MKKRLLLLGMMTMLMGLLLTGCMQITEKAEVHADGSGSMTAEILYEKQAVFEYVNSVASEDETLTEKEMINNMEAAGYLLIEKDGKEYFSAPATEGLHFSKLSEFYISELMGKLMYVDEENAISLTETSVEFVIPADATNSDSWLGSSSPEAGDVSMIGGMSKEQLKACKICFTYSFDTPIVKASENAVLSEDKKTVSFSFSLLEEKTSQCYAYCENDIAVEGVKSGMIYGKDVSFTIPEGVTATVNGVKQTGTKIVSDQTRAYEVILKKDATQKTLNYMVDKTAPEVKNIVNGGVYGSKVKAELTDKESGIAKILIDGTDVTGEVAIDMDSASGNLTDISFIYTYDFSSLKEGTHTIEAQDNAGNTTTVKFTCDKTAPKVAGVKNNKTYKKAVTIKVSDKNGVKSIKLNGKKIKSGKKITKKGSYKLVVTDKAGNTKTVKFKIKK